MNKKLYVPPIAEYLAEDEYKLGLWYGFLLGVLVQAVLTAVLIYFIG